MLVPEMKTVQEWINIALLTAVILGEYTVNAYIEVQFDDFEYQSGVKGAYELGKDLGRGKEGIVTEANEMKQNDSKGWEITNKKFAVKRLSLKLKDKAKKEYEVCRSYHKNNPVKGLVYLRGYGNTIPIGNRAGGCVIVMDIVEGITIEKYLKNHPSLTQFEKIRVALELMVNVLPTFDFIHGLEIFHNDVMNPGNFMLNDAEGRPTDFTLIDFGNAVPNAGIAACKKDLLGLLVLFCTITSLDLGANNYGIPADSISGTALYEALNAMCDDVTLSDRSNQYFGYEAYKTRFSNILPMVEKDIALNQ